MTQVSIANLPAFVGSGFDPADLVAVVDTSDTTESPLGTTKRGTFAQLASFGGPITATPNIIVTGTAVQSRGLAFQTVGSNRWYLFASAAAETGGNVGSDFQLNAYADDGSTLIDTPIAIQRKAGSPILLQRAVNAPSLTVSGQVSVGGLTVTAAIGTIDLPGAANGVIRFGGSATLYQQSGTDTVLAGAPGRGIIFGLPELFSSSTSSYLRIAGGNPASSGANIVLFGQSHASAPNVVQINGSASIQLNPNSGVVVVGPDPGGTQLLRVGGATVISGQLSVFATIFASGPDGSYNFRVTGLGTADRLRVNPGFAGNGVTVQAVDAGETAQRPLIFAATQYIFTGLGGGGQNLSVGAANSGGAGFRMVVVPN